MSGKVDKDVNLMWKMITALALLSLGCAGYLNAQDDKKLDKEVFKENQKAIVAMTEQNKSEHVEFRMMFGKLTDKIEKKDKDTEDKFDRIIDILQEHDK